MPGLEPQPDIEHRDVEFGADIEVHIPNQDEYQTKVAITALQEVPVHRKEVYEKIREEETKH